jgi:hypothetical protein
MKVRLQKKYNGLEKNKHKKTGIIICLSFNFCDIKTIGIIQRQKKIELIIRPDISKLILVVFTKKATTL